MTVTGNKSVNNPKPNLTAKDRERMAAGRSKGPDHLTPTQRNLISNIASHQVDDGFVAISKREMAQYLGKCEKTIDRVVSDLRRRGRRTDCQCVQGYVGRQREVSRPGKLAKQPTRRKRRARRNGRRADLEALTASM